MRARQSLPRFAHPLSNFETGTRLQIFRFARSNLLFIEEYPGFDPSQPTPASPLQFPIPASSSPIPGYFKP